MYHLDFRLLFLHIICYKKDLNQCEESKGLNKRDYLFRVGVLKSEVMSVQKRVYSETGTLKGDT